MSLSNATYNFLTWVKSINKILGELSHTKTTQNIINNDVSEQIEIAMTIDDLSILNQHIANSTLSLSKLSNDVIDYIKTINYKGTYNPSTNTPYLINGVGEPGSFYDVI